jgi:NAD(P)-dependent dehydrogenase (short-subunit alcohol dehydrogenase family)
MVPRLALAPGLTLVVALGMGCQPYYNVEVATPTRATLDVSAFDRVLVAGFAAAGHETINLNDETVRLLRSQLRGQSRLQVAEADPVRIDTGRLQDGVELAGSVRVVDEHGEGLTRVDPLGPTTHHGRFETGSHRLEFEAHCSSRRGRRERVRDIEATDELGVRSDLGIGTAVDDCERGASIAEQDIGRAHVGLRVVERIRPHIEPGAGGTIAYQRTIRIVDIGRDHSDAGGLEELDDEIRKDGGSATLVPLSLTDTDGIARLGAALHERGGKLDILVGNAGVPGPSSPLGHIELKPWNDVIAVNVTANFQLIRCMEPLLKRSDAGRAVFVTSGAANKATAYVGPYAASKAALETLARAWAQETASTNIRVNLFNPGPIRTRMRATVFPGEDPETLDTPEQAAEFVVPMCVPAWNETGKFYDYKTRTLMSFRAPA